MKKKIIAVITGAVILIIAAGRIYWKPESGHKMLSGKLNDAPSGRLFRADFRTLQMCQSL